jgi:HK97 family phage prohead protease
MSIIHKTTESSASGGDFILSDATPDHYDDTIDPNGWDLENFKKNPIALFNHNSDFPIGRWTNLRIEKGALRGRLVMAPEGTSPRIDELRKLISCGVLRAVSVGFKPIKSEPRKSGGRSYTAQTLVETSLVCIPANPSALLQAKALGVSTATIKMIFKEQNKNASLAERIADARSSIRYSEQQRRDIHRKAKAKVAKLNAKETKTQTERVDKAMAQARARIAAKKAKQDPPTENKNDWPDGWPDQDFYVWRGQRIQRDWTRWKEKK